MYSYPSIRKKLKFEHGGTTHDLDLFDDEYVEEDNTSEDTSTSFDGTVNLVSGLGSGISSVGPSSDGEKQASTKSPESGGYVPWKQYQDANKEKFETLGKQVIGDTPEQTQQLKREYSTESEHQLGEDSEFYEESNRIAGGRGKIDDLLDKVDSGQSLSPQERQLWDDFQNPSNTQFNLPLYQEQKKRTKDIKDKASNLMTPGGLGKEIASATGPKSTYRGQNFDLRGVQQSDIGKSGIRKTKEAAQGLGNWGNLQKMIQNSQGEIYKQRPELANYGANAGDERLDEYRTERDESTEGLVSGFNDAFSSGGSSEISKQDASRFGLKDGERLYGLDINKLFDPNADSFKRGLETPQEAKRRNTLRDLLGQASKTNPESVPAIIRQELTRRENVFKTQVVPKQKAIAHQARAIGILNYLAYARQIHSANNAEGTRLIFKAKDAVRAGHITWHQFSDVREHGSTAWQFNDLRALHGKTNAALRQYSDYYQNNHTVKVI